MDEDSALPVAAVCMRPEPSPPRNVARICDTIAAARASGDGLVVFPECAVQGYPLGLGAPDLDQYEYQAAHAETVPGNATEAVRKALSNSPALAVVGLTERGDAASGEASHLFNTSVLIGESGVLAKYRKVHTGGVEKCLWSRGKTWRTHDIGGGTIGFLICYDLVFPEAARALALRGADMLVLSTAWARSEDPTFLSGYDLFTRARALENQVFLVSANLVDGPGVGFHGHSRIVDPTGVVMDEVAGEGIARARIDLARDVNRHRSRSWFGQVFLRDRAPDAYDA